MARLHAMCYRTEWENDVFTGHERLPATYKHRLHGVEREAGCGG